MSLSGASKGLLTNSKDLCKAPQKAKLQMTAQNGRSFNRKVKLQSACKARKKQKRAKRGALRR